MPSHTPSKRTDNKNDPHKLADIDRIEYLLARRRQIEGRREVALNQSVARLTKELAYGPDPKGWAAVAPVYPWRDLCSPASCYEFLQEIEKKLGHPGNSLHEVQRVPDGAIMRTTSRFATGKALPTDAYLVRADGMVVCMRTVRSLDRRHRHGVEMIAYEDTEKLYEATPFWEKIARLFLVARQFYARGDVEAPGLLALELGLDWVLGIQLIHQGQAGRPFLENSYHDTATIESATFMEPSEGLDSLRRRLFFGFDIEIPDESFYPFVTS